jgi:hypothetical protein
MQLQRSEDVRTPCRCHGVLGRRKRTQAPHGIVLEVFEGTTDRQMCLEFGEADDDA